MPFGFKIRRAKRYNVSTKYAYVVCVQLLDKTLIECTLTAESTGRECMENIAQRIELRELEYFGLRYVNKKLQQRWVELGKPLKRQLDKHANSPVLEFGVLFYTPQAHKIEDDMARYQYYLQLKSDVIEGRVACSSEQAVQLASYSVQAELGDHQPEQHGPGQLRDFVLLPRTLTSDEARLSELTAQVCSAHSSLTGVSPHLAEQHYILEASQLEHCGMGVLDHYAAKDDESQDVLLTAYHRGLCARYSGPEPRPRHTGDVIRLYSWAVITNLLYNRRMLVIETAMQEKPAHFQLDDPDVAKYVHRTCSLLHAYYTGRKSSADVTDPLHSPGATGPIPDVTQQAHAIQRLQQEAESLNTTADTTVTSSLTQDISMTSALSGQNLSQSHSGLLEADSPVAPPSAHAQTALRAPFHLPASHSQQLAPSGGGGAAPAVLSVSSQPNVSSQGALSVPQYRPSPDYDTVLRLIEQQQGLARAHHVSHLGQVGAATPQLGVRHQGALQERGLGAQQVYANSESLAYSQPDIGSATPVIYRNNRGHVTFQPDLSSVALRNQYNLYQPTRPVDRAASLIIHPTYSTPDLCSPPRVAPLSQHAAAPPGGRPSSTPDLATPAGGAAVGNSPDLVSRRHLGAGNLQAVSRLDQSVENLALEGAPLTLTQGRGAPGGGQLPRAPPQRAAQHHLYENLPLKGSSGDVSTSHSSLHTNSSATTPGTPQDGHPPTLALPHPLVGRLTSQEREIMIDSQPAPAPRHPAVLAPRVTTTPELLRHKPHSAHAPDPNLLRRRLDMDRSQPVVLQQTPDIPSETSTPYESLKDDFMSLVRDSAAGCDSSSVHDSSATSGVVNAAFSENGNDTSLNQSRLSSDTASLTSSGSTSVKVTSKPAGDSESPACAQDPPRQPGVLKLAAMNGLCVSRASVLEPTAESDRVPKDERRKTLEQRLEEGQVFKEFEQIPKKRLRCDCSVAGRPENKDRNRFKDVHPYDDNRVKLMPTKDNPTGYINASHIKMKIRAEEWWYIAAQGPLVNSINAFWQMLWENEVEVVAMLTGLVEFSKQKCARYWPEQRGPKHSCKYGDYQVTLKFSTSSASYVTSGLQLRHLPSKRERMVWHLQYTDWPDHGCPEDVHGFLAYLDEVASMRRHAQSECKDGRKSPVVVHCSAGVGRSGVLILAELMKNYDVPMVLRKLREQRMHLVQTIGQYNFVYATLIQFLKNSRLI